MHVQQIFRKGIAAGISCLLLAAAWPIMLFAETGSFPGIEQLMTREQFEAAGLDKLSVKEREALNAWLLGYTVEEAPVLMRSNQQVQDANDDITIAANLSAAFEGWDGNTLFYLDNGQVWRQRLDGRYRYLGSDRGVVIAKNILGFYKMTLTATNKSIGVSRVK